MHALLIHAIRLAFHRDVGWTAEAAIRYSSGMPDGRSEPPPAKTKWAYEADEKPKKKHGWNKDEPGFKRVRKELVGKCPVSMTCAQAEQLLNEQSVAFHNPHAPGPIPDRLYVVHDGTVYRAAPTRPGHSFHAFPELPERLRSLPIIWRKKIWALADRLGCREQVDDWFER